MTRHALAWVEAPDIGAVHDEGETMEMQALASLHAAATPEMRDALGLAWAEDAEAAVSTAAALPRLATGDRVAGIGRFFLHFRRASGCCRTSCATMPWRTHGRGRSSCGPAARRCPTPPPWKSRGSAPARRRRLPRASSARPSTSVRRPSPGSPAGTGALFSDGGIGWTDWGAAAPAFRGRGVQRALLAHRLRVADTVDLVRFHTCTGAPAPGDPQKSDRNILRHGFAETVQRRNLAPAARDRPVIDPIRQGVRC